MITAVFGSCRFEKTLLSCSHSRFALPPHVRIALSSGGSRSSSTPVLVRRVKEWKARGEAAEVWGRYRRNNDRLVGALSEGGGELKSLFKEKLEIMYEMSELSGANIVPRELYEVMK